MKQLVSASLFSPDSDFKGVVGLTFVLRASTNVNNVAEFYFPLSFLKVQTQYTKF